MEKRYPLSRRRFLGLVGAAAALAACSRALPTPAPSPVPGPTATPTEPPPTPTPTATPVPTRAPIQRHAGSSFPGVGEWACYRGNGTNDAWAPGKGKIGQPQVAWKQFVGAIETLLVAEPGAGDGTLSAPLGQLAAPVAEATDQRWGLIPRLVEIEGVQQPLARDVCVTYAHVLPEEPGLQKLEFESGFNKPTVGGSWARCVGRCFAWRSGAWAKVWETEEFSYLFQPLPIVGDFDGDGNPEVAILPWYELVVLDARTGKIKDQCSFTEGRSYGFFGVYDLDGDGKSEFVVQADYAKHVDVLGYKNGKLSLLWQKQIEMGFGDPQKVLRVCPNPVGDVDGDGKLEVLINLYNGEGDERWHVTVHDGMSGAVKADLVDEHLDAVLDVDGDKVAELLTTRAAGAGVGAYGPVQVRSLKGGKLATLWQHDRAGWQIWNPPQAENVNSAATLANRDVLSREVGGRRMVALRQQVADHPDEVELVVAAWDKGGFQPSMSVRGRYLEGRALDDKGALLVSCITRPGQTATVTVHAGKGRALSSQEKGIDPGVAVVAREAGKPAATVLAQGYGEELVAFQAPQGGQPAVERWRLLGRGQSYQWPQALGPVLADLAGDGKRQMVYATAAPNGCGRIVVADLDGKEVWHHDFQRIAGTAPVWNLGGVILWQVGHFTDKQRQDVLVTVRRSIMHSDETYLLSGQDGHELWHRDHQLYDRGMSGQPYAIADFDGDGLDDACSLYPDLFYILTGATGEDMFTPKQGPYWGQPVAGDWLGNGKPTVFFATQRASVTGLYLINGSLAWADAFDKSPSSLAAFGDVDGDGWLETVGVGYEDGIRCYDIAHGQVKWRLPTPVPDTPTGSASADLNGDGRDEVVFVVGKTVYCLGTGESEGQGKLLWKLDLPAPAGPPSIGDVDGDGTLSLILVGSDGYVYCVR